MKEGNDGDELAIILDRLRYLVDLIEDFPYASAPLTVRWELLFLARALQHAEDTFQQTGPKPLDWCIADTIAAIPPEPT
jgi:hypothetical protein